MLWRLSVRPILSAIYYRSIKSATKEMLWSHASDQEVDVLSPILQGETMTMTDRITIGRGSWIVQANGSTVAYAYNVPEGSWIWGTL